MQTKVVNFIMDNIKKNCSYNDTKLLEIKYGIETLYLTITKSIVTIGLAIILNLVKELALLILFYSIIRLFGFGAHAKKAIHCWISSLTIFTLLPYLIKTIAINKCFVVAICIICLILLAIYAPADTPRRPLIHKKKRIVYKVLTILVAFIYIVYILLTDNNYYHNVLFFSILIQSVLVLPITYKLFGITYNNYKSYKKKGELK